MKCFTENISCLIENIHKVVFIYSPTQSLCNSLLGDVVLDSFNKVYRDEDSILDQTYRKQICLYNISYNTKMHNNIEVALKPNFMGY